MLCIFSPSFSGLFLYVKARTSAWPGACPHLPEPSIFIERFLGTTKSSRCYHIQGSLPVGFCITYSVRKILSLINSPEYGLHLAHAPVFPSIFIAHSFCSHICVVPYNVFGCLLTQLLGPTYWQYGRRESLVLDAEEVPNDSLT